MLNPLGICFVCNEYPPGPHGGIGTSTQNLARALTQAGHHVRVIGIYPKSYPAADYEEDEGVHVWRLRRRGFRYGWILDRCLLYRTIRMWAKRGEIDVIDVPDWEGVAAGWPRLPVPVISRLCGSQSYFAAELSKPVKKTMYWLERASLRRADFWCSKSAYTAEKTREVFAFDTGPDAILYNPAPVPADMPYVERTRTRVVYTGTLTKKKGVMSLIQAWPRVRAACADAELHLYGKDGKTSTGQSMRAHLEAQLNGQRNTVHFHGHVGRQGVTDALRSAAVAVFPSYAEAFANAPLEAMACACPTIYSRRGSGPELIESGKTGLLVDPNDPREIADAIVRILRDDRLAYRLGNAGRERVNREFSVPAIVEQNVAFYYRCSCSFSRTTPRRCCGGIAKPT